MLSLTIDYAVSSAVIAIAKYDAAYDASKRPIKAISEIVWLGLAGDINIDNSARPALREV